MIYLANCKINIGLNILSKRADGFHNLSTIMYPLREVCDIVEVVHSDNFKFTSSGLDIDCNNDNNLCYKAYKLLVSEFNLSSPVHIHLHKIVPFGAGLGGGSSDATFTLKAISELLDLNISNSKMKELAAKMGSDTSFFVDNTPQLCSSRGEITENININLKGKYLTIVKPNINISTKEAFSGIIPKEPDFKLKDLPKIDISDWKYHVKNDFEPHIFKLYPSLKIIKDKLYDLGALYASMSGSGSTIYAISDSLIDKNNFDAEVFFRSYKE